MANETIVAKQSPSAKVIPTYDRELTEQEELTVKNIIKILDKNQVKDEIVRGRIFSKHKAFTRDVFNAGCDAGVL